MLLPSDQNIEREPVLTAGFGHEACTCETSHIAVNADVQHQCRYLDAVYQIWYAPVSKLKLSQLGSALAVAMQIPVVLQAAL